MAYKKEKGDKWADARELDAFMRKLTNVETKALSLIRPFDVRTLQPVAVQIDTPEKREIYNYFRVVISSAGQGVHAQGMGRFSEWFLMDKTSGAFLGLWSYFDVILPWKPFDAWVGGKIGHGGSPRANHVIQLKRCLPLFEFGNLTGGKLMALVAHSTDILKVAEYRYSFDIAVMIIKTLHGKSSQYNRLHQRGVEWIGEQADGKGLYISKLYENAKPFLLSETDDLGPRLTYSYAEQVAYWKERWLPNRMDRTDGGWCRPDPSQYALSSQMRERINMRLYPQEHA